MRTVFISDKNNEQRRQNVQDETSKIGLAFTFFDAIMANRMNPNEVASKALPNTFLTSSEIGCALSHLGVYKEFLSSNDKSILICEDDIYFTDEFTLERVEAIRQFVEETDEPRIVVLQKSIYHNVCIEDVDKSLSIYSALNLFGTLGYIINRKAAENIVQIQNIVRFEIDAFKFYYWLDKCHLYCLNRDLILPVEEDIITSTVSGNNSEISNMISKQESFKPLYQQLSFRGKILCHWRRLRKALHRPFETLDY